MSVNRPQASPVLVRDGEEWGLGALPPILHSAEVFEGSMNPLTSIRALPSLTCHACGSAFKTRSAGLEKTMTALYWMRALPAANRSDYRGSEPLQQQHCTGNENQRRQGLRHRLFGPHAAQPGQRRNQQQQDQQLPKFDSEVEPHQ